jgi:hypothetical protein
MIAQIRQFRFALFAHDRTSIAVIGYVTGGAAPFVIGRLASWIGSQSMRSGGHKARS